jgi:co-chaperonin GroES (HSP10)
MTMTDTEDKTLFDELPTLRNMTNAEAANQPVEEKPKQLPDPTGYRILCAVPDVEEKFSSGLYKADITKQYEELTTPVLFVLKLGPDAYKDERKFPTGAWCKEGDFILTRPMAGSRVKIHGREFRILNDDSVEAVVEDPRGISRA